ncbi:MAG: hypothetical protein ACRDNK_24055, partial [Solirubrobacteraceae bacterium]
VLADTSATMVAMSVRPLTRSFLRHFSIFRNTSAGYHKMETTASQAPGLIGDMTQSPAAPPFMQGTALSNLHSQVVDAPGTTHAIGTVWAIPGPGGVCVAAHVDRGSGDRVVGTCNTAAVAAQSGVTGTLYNNDGTTTTFGLMPNGNATADVRTVSGGRMPVPVRDNVFMTTIGKRHRVARPGARGAKTH